MPDEKSHTSESLFSSSESNQRLYRINIRLTGWLGVNSQFIAAAANEMNSVDCFVTYCVRRVNAALVIEVGRLSPFVISLQIFLLITSTRPPFSVTSLYSMYRSRTCLAMMGMRLTGVPMQEKEGEKKSLQYKSKI